MAFSNVDGAACGCGKGFGAGIAAENLRVKKREQTKHPRKCYSLGVLLYCAHLSMMVKFLIGRPSMYLCSWFTCYCSIKARRVPYCSL